MTPESASLLAAGIAAAASIGVAVVGVLGARNHRATRDALAENTHQTGEVLHQVRNDHETNLRDDLDQLAELVASHTVKLGDLDAGQSRVASMLGTVRKTVDSVQDQQRSHDAASLLIVEELHRADRELASEIRHHHPG